MRLQGLAQRHEGEERRDPGDRAVGVPRRQRQRDVHRNRQQQRLPRNRKPTDAEQEPAEHSVEQDDHHETGKTELLTQGGRDEVGLGEGDEVGLAAAEARAEHSAAEGEVKALNAEVAALAKLVDRDHAEGGQVMDLLSVKSDRKTSGRERV